MASLLVFDIYHKQLRFSSEYDAGCRENDFCKIVTWMRKVCSLSDREWTWSDGSVAADAGWAIAECDAYVTTSLQSSQRDNTL